MAKTPYLYTFKFTGSAIKDRDTLLAEIPMLRKYLPFDKITVVTVGTACSVYINCDPNQEIYVKADDTQTFGDLRVWGFKVDLVDAGAVRLICQKTKI